MHRSSTSTASNIKNLAIALEALSRFPHEQQLSDAITSSLKKEIQIMQEEQYPLTTHVTIKPRTVDEEISF